MQIVTASTIANAVPSPNVGRGSGTHLLPFAPIANLPPTPKLQITRLDCSLWQETPVLGINHNFFERHRAAEKVFVNQ